MDQPSVCPSAQGQNGKQRSLHRREREIRFPVADYFVGRPCASLLS